MQWRDVIYKMKGKQREFYFSNLKFNPDTRKIDDFRRKNVFFFSPGSQMECSKCVIFIFILFYQRGKVPGEDGMTPMLALGMVGREAYCLRMMSGLFMAQRMEQILISVLLVEVQVNNVVNVLQFSFLIRGYSVIKLLVNSTPFVNP